jgi:large subunit ribosomal protein L3
MSLCSLICKKIGMSQVFSASGKVIAVTLLDVEENIVISARTDQSRTFLQIASFAQKAHRLSKSVRGMYKKISSKPQKVIKQFTVDTDKNIFKTGDVLSVKCLKIGSFVDISGKSIGKGYSGVMKKIWF